MAENITGYYDLWHDSCYGSEFYNQEIQILKSHIEKFFGFHILQIGASELEYFKDLSDNLKINHRLVLKQYTKLPDDSKMPRGTVITNKPSEPQGSVSVLYGNDNSLPLETASIDAVLIAHNLEFSTDPYGNLREVDRILMPEGHLIILGFNPWSLWGVRKVLTGYNVNCFPWDGSSKWFSSYRICDWLTLLNYQVKHKIHFFYRPCVNNKKILGYTKAFEQIGKIFPFGSAGFCIIAEKKQESFTLVRTNWQHDLNFVSSGRRTQPSLKIKNTT